MFNLQGGELMIILLLALVVLGPEKLPEAMRKLGKMYGEVKRMSTGFQEEFRSAVDEPIREFRKAVDEPMNEIRGTASALRDSADFRRFEAGGRTEKSKSGDMAAITDSAALLSAADVDAVPVESTPSFQPADGSDPDPGPLHDDDPVASPARKPAQDSVQDSTGAIDADQERSAAGAPSANTKSEKPPADNGRASGNDAADHDAADHDAADHDAADGAQPLLHREKPGASE